MTLCTVAFGIPRPLRPLLHETRLLLSSVEIVAGTGMDDLNYFTCTLGQAVEVNKKNPHEYQTINEFLDHQARVVPERLAVGFPVPSSAGQDDKWDYMIFCIFMSARLPLGIALIIL